MPSAHRVSLIRFVEAAEEQSSLSAGSLIDGAVSAYRELPLGAKIGIPILAAPLVAGTLIEGLALGAVAAVGIAGAEAFSRLSNSSSSAKESQPAPKTVSAEKTRSRSPKSKVSHVMELDVSEASSYRVLGEGVPSSEITYATHPFNPSLLAPAARFHAHMLDEQVEAISRYAASKVRLKRLAISVRQGQTGKVFAGGQLNAVPVTAGAELSAISSHAFLAEYIKPPRMTPLDNDNDWMSGLPSLKQAFDLGGSGTIRRAERRNMGFGLNAKAAGLAGVSAEWLGDFEFIVEATFLDRQ